jgi:hypothetical protein
MSILSIITLIAELAPKVIAAGGAVADLLRTASGIVEEAERTGKVDADAEMRLRALVQVQLDKLAAYAAEARNTELDPA